MSRAVCEKECAMVNFFVVESTENIRKTNSYCHWLKVCESNTECAVETLNMQPFSALLSERLCQGS